jgi:signal transduction histidine kinase/CheY-like chemotaxis protein/HPt (histidine-containing phosphotransfer) domain-containing protein
MTCATALVWWLARREVNSHRLARFMKEVDRTQQAVSTRLNRYRLVLRAARSSLLAGETLAGQEWREFVSGLSLKADCPGFPFLTFIEYLPHHKSVRSGAAGGEQDPQYHPRWPPGERDAYFVTRFIAPPENNGFLLGFDFGTDPAARACLEASERSRTDCISTKLQCTPQTREATYLMSLPVIRNAGSPSRREEFLGWVAAPLQISSFLKDTLAGTAGEIDIELFEDPALTRETLLHDFDSTLRGAEGPSSGGLSHTATLKLAERKWYLHFTSLPAFEHGVDWTTPKLVILCGGILTALILSLLYKRKLVEDRVRAEAVSGLKSEFLANMSHEIRTPMTSILGYLDLLEDPSEGPAAKEKYLDIIRRNGRHLLQIINDVLDISKIEAGRLTVQRIHCSTLEIVRDVTALLGSRATEKGLAFDVAFHGPIPATIHTDPTRLRQVLLNLIGNSIKFTEKGGIVLSTRLIAAADTSPSLLRFDVTDTGVGISQEDQEKLFRPFSQVDSSSTRRHGGTGLGLVLSRRLAQLLGGDISVESRPGAGSTFSVTVETGPLEASRMLTDPAALAVPGEKELGEDVVVRLDGRLLIADDAPEIQHLVAFHLKRRGAEIEFVKDGEEACQAALAALKAGEPFDAILMDMQMPVLDGLAATGRLRESGYQGPIIALTANAMEGYREKCLAEGCTDFLTKPLDPPALLKTMAKYLSKAPEAAPEPPAQPQAPGRETPAVLRSSLADDPEFSDLLPLFVKSLEETIEQMEDALSLGDLATLARLAHYLKGSAGSYGFPEITEAAIALEAALKAGAPLGTLENEFNRLSSLAGVVVP